MADLDGEANRELIPQSRSPLLRVVNRGVGVVLTGLRQFVLTARV